MPVADRELPTFAAPPVAGRKASVLGRWLGALALLAGASDPAFAHVKWFATTT